MPFFLPKSSFTRPNDTTAYTANDLVANSTTAGSVTPLTFNVEETQLGSGRVFGAILKKSGTTTTLAKFDLNLFHRIPVVTNGDNGAFAIDTAQYWWGKISFDMTSGALAGTAYATSVVQMASPQGLVFDTQVNGLPQTAYQPPMAIYGYLVATAGYTPVANEVFEVSLMTEYGH